MKRRAPSPPRRGRWRQGVKLAANGQVTVRSQSGHSQVTVRSQSGHGFLRIFWKGEPLEPINNIEYIISLLKNRKMPTKHMTWLWPDRWPDCDLTVTWLWPDCQNSSKSHTLGASMRKLFGVGFQRSSVLDQALSSVLEPRFGTMVWDNG